MRGLWYDCRVSGLCATTPHRIASYIKSKHFGNTITRSTSTCTLRWRCLYYSVMCDCVLYDLYLYFRDVRNPFALCPSLSICVTELHYLLCLSLLIHILIHPSIYACNQWIRLGRWPSIIKFYVRNTLNACIVVLNQSMLIVRHLMAFIQCKTGRHIVVVCQRFVVGCAYGLWWDFRLGSNC